MISTSRIFRLFPVKWYISCWLVFFLGPCTIKVLLLLYYSSSPAAFACSINYNSNADFQWLVSSIGFSLVYVACLHFGVFWFFPLLFDGVTWMLSGLCQFFRIHKGVFYFSYLLVLTGFSISWFAWLCFYES